MKEQRKDPQHRRRNVQAALIVRSIADELITKEDAHALSAGAALQTLTRDDLKILAKPILGERTERASGQMLIGAAWMGILRGNEESAMMLSHVASELLNSCFSEHIVPLLRERIYAERKTERVTAWLVYAVEALISHDLASESSCSFAFGDKQELLNKLTLNEIGELIVNEEQGALDRVKYQQLLQKYGILRAVKKAQLRAVTELILCNASELPQVSRTSISTPASSENDPGEDYDSLPTIKPSHIPGMDDLAPLPPQTPISNAGQASPSPTTREDAIRNEILTYLERHGASINGNDTAKSLDVLKKNPLHFTLLALIGEHIPAEGRRERLLALHKNSVKNIVMFCRDMLLVSNRTYAKDIVAILTRTYPDQCHPPIRP